MTLAKFATRFPGGPNIRNKVLSKAVGPVWQVKIGPLDERASLAFYQNAVYHLIKSDPEALTFFKELESSAAPQSGPVALLKIASAMITDGIVTSETTTEPVPAQVSGSVPAVHLPHVASSSPSSSTSAITVTVPRDGYNTAITTYISPLTRFLPTTRSIASPDDTDATREDLSVNGSRLDKDNDGNNNKKQQRRKAASLFAGDAKQSDDKQKKQPPVKRKSKAQNKAKAKSKTKTSKAIQTKPKKSSSVTRQAKTKTRGVTKKRKKDGTDEEEEEEEGEKHLTTDANDSSKRDSGGSRNKKEDASKSQQRVEERWEEQQL